MKVTSCIRRLDGGLRRSIAMVSAAACLLTGLSATGPLSLIAKAESARKFAFSDFLVGRDAAAAGCTITEQDGGVVVSKRGGDNHATTDASSAQFTFQADLEVLEGPGNGVLTFGVSNRENPTTGSWYGVCANRTGNPYPGELRLFKVDNGLPVDEHVPMTQEQMAAKANTIQITVDAQKVIKVYLDGELMIQRQDESFQGGFVGICTNDSQVKFSNMRFQEGPPETEEPGGFHTNLKNLTPLNGIWADTPNGLQGRGNGDCFALSDTVGSDFIYETKVHIEQGDAASLVFRSSDDGKLAYVANVDLGAMKNARIFKFTGNGAVTLGEYRLSDTSVKDYTLRVEAVGNRLTYFLNGKKIISCTDSQFSSGKMGLLICNSTSVFQDTVFTQVDSGTPRLTGLRLEETAYAPAFDSNTFSYTAQVGYETTSIKLTPEAAQGTGITVSAVNQSGEPTLAKTDLTQPSIDIPLSEGLNTVLIETKKEQATGLTTCLTVKRQGSPETYYTEPYRPQYHITPESGWLNDPNGLVYFDGEYHAFYQYYADSKFPGDLKSWAHMVSTDLVHWEPLPVALEPDEYGSIWSGSAVVDHNNSSGLFDDVPGKTGLVAFYTSTDTNDGLRQRQAMAYSKDKGRTWIKYNGGKPIINSEDDPLHDGAFRDPKVFWHEESGQWMMIVAGGPVRFYSSKNLIDWKPEGMQPEIGTECADLFPMPVDGNIQNQKWILSGGGVWYMIGDFKQVDGVWKFVPDTGERLPFNRAPDVYAGVTFNNVPGDRRIMLHWMVNISYPFQTGEITDPWNGALSLPYELALKTVDGKLQLIQNPVEELSSLRGEEFSLQNVRVSPDTANPLQDITADKAEITAVIDPGDAQEFGFQLRAGNGQYTSVTYNAVTNMLTLDRAKAGKSPTDSFPGAYSCRVTPENGVIKLHMYLDWSSLELFAQDGREAFTALIYPDRSSMGMSFYAKGGTAVIQSLQIYELDSLYNSPTPSDAPKSISVSGAKSSYEVGEQFTLWAAPKPVNAKGAQATFTVSDPSVLQVVRQGERSVVLKALKKGTCTVSAVTKKGNLTGTATVTVTQPNFRTNLTGWSALGGSWETTSEGYRGISGGNGPVFTQTKAGDFTYEATVTYQQGNVGTALIFRASDDFSVYYSADICERDKKARILRFHRDPVTGASSDITLGTPYTFEPTADHTYHLKVVAKGENIQFYVNGKLAVQASSRESLSGRFGLNVCDVTAVFQDVVYSEPARLTGLSLSSGTLSPGFSETFDRYRATVSAQTESITLTPVWTGAGSVTVNGKSVTSGQPCAPISLKPGDNDLSVAVLDSQGALLRTVTVTVTREVPDSSSDSSSESSSSSSSGSGSSGASSSDPNSSPASGQSSFPGGDQNRPDSELPTESDSSSAANGLSSSGDAPSPQTGSLYSAILPVLLIGACSAVCVTALKKRK